MNSKIIKTTILCLGLIIGSSLYAGEYTYAKGIKELRINDDNSVYVYLHDPMQETSCDDEIQALYLDNDLTAEHYVLEGWNGGNALIFRALLTAYITGKKVSIKTVTDSCNDDNKQPRIKFMRLR